MLLLLSGSAKALRPYMDCSLNAYGWLLTPRRTSTQSGLAGLRYGVDNECFTLGSAFDPERYRRALETIAETHGRAACLFATAPDVVADAAATLKQFGAWADSIRRLLPVALVAQDGLECLDVPWDDLDALFIGGSTAWKLGPHAARLSEEAKERNKWVHIGRVNSTYRAMRLRVPPDSVDGTAWVKHPAKYAVGWQRWVRLGMPRQPMLLHT